jgi:PAS domain S-box-containing protein
MLIVRAMQGYSPFKCDIYFMTDKERIAQLEAKIVTLHEEYRKQMLNLEKFKAMVMNLNQGIMVVDNEERITKVYESFEILTGYKEHELLGRFANDVFLIKGDMVTELQMREQHAMRDKGETGYYEIPIRRKDCEIIWVSISGAPLYDNEGNKIGSLGIHYDITRQKRLQQALQEAREESDQAKHAEERFLAKMSHEIRTPLNAVIGMSYLLQGTQLNGEQKDYTDVIARSGNLLLNLINDILDYSKINSGQVEVRMGEFNLYTTLHDLAQTFRLKTSNKEVQVLLEADIEFPMVRGDETLLNQVFMNLLGNSEKFTEKGYLKIIAEPLAEFDDKITYQFTVEDTGEGIDKTRLEAIFQEFVQEEGVILKNSKGGTGLGLSITKKIIELLGGKIWVESTPGVGTQMHFVLNLEICKDQPDNSELVDNQATFTSTSCEEIPSSFRLLIAEDNPMNQKYISKILEKKGLNFEVVPNGKLAVKATEEEKFDLIFMDLFMPVMDGFEAVSNIKKGQNKNSDTPIFALTATAVQQHKDKALKIGMEGFISKPFHPNEVFSVIKKVCTRKHYPEESKNSTMESNHSKEVFTYSSAFDHSMLEIYYGNDTHYALEMFEIFLEQLSETLPLITSALHLEDRKALRHHVHKLKPTFTMVGFPALTTYFEKWENDLDNETIPFSDFSGYWDRVQNEVFNTQDHVDLEIQKIKIFHKKS